MSAGKVFLTLALLAVSASAAAEVSDDFDTSLADRVVIGKSTRQAMLIGAVHGYRGLIRELIQKLKDELKCRRLPVVATGGYAKLMASKLPEITAVDPLLTLKGLRIAWELNQDRAR